MNHQGAQPQLKGTWPQALGTFFLPILLVMGVRWAFVEPFVIPSGSMIPNLLIHDHILVKKFSLGLRVPWSDRWLVRWREPQRGEVMVFKYPQNTDVFYIKRLIGMPGDRVEVRAGRIQVNGESWSLNPEKISQPELGFDYFRESIPAPAPSKPSSHIVRFISAAESETDSYKENEIQVFIVPQDQYFFMGDNRDQSSDSRFWGFVKKDYLIGPAWMIWLSCDSTLPSMSYVCDPSQMRWSRIGRFL